MPLNPNRPSIYPVNFIVGHCKILLGIMLAWWTTLSHSVCLSDVCDRHQCVWWLV